MTILTFPWDDVGPCSGLEPSDICNTLDDGYTGYTATRPETTRMTKGFKITHRMMLTAQWLALIEFWRSVHGTADAFYWQFPIAMYDVAGFGGDNMGIEDLGGWDTEGDGMGFGTGPVFLARFKGNVLNQKHIKPFYWGVSYVVEEI
jgi:hypothetical protein